MKDPYCFIPEPVVQYGKGFCAIPCDDPKYSWDIVVPPQEIILEDGEFVIVGNHGQRLICTLTGRQRWINSTWRAVTIHTYEIETVTRPLADGSAALWGIRGERNLGTWAIHRKALTVAGEALLRA